MVEGIIEQSGTPYFCFKDLDENKPSGSIKIRVETIDYFLRRYREEVIRKRKAAQDIEAQLDVLRTIQRAHVISNGIFVAAINRNGFEGTPESGLEFWGNSFVSDPFGRILAQAGTSEDQVLVTECDPKLMDETRRNWPFLRDRRIDAYGPLTERWLG